VPGPPCRASTAAEGPPYVLLHFHVHPCPSIGSHLYQVSQSQVLFLNTKESIQPDTLSTWLTVVLPHSQHPSPELMSQSYESSIHGTHLAKGSMRKGRGGSHTGSH
jgi:hypothetical protein